ncbi:hypothetical protein CWB96_00415 [Pseudoalteromonas citrea]|uniref:DUF4815 domain-containing protein n=1 Tax=Pseudoalteromonas citrea TaxID=43655 RepID=A0A5S3XW87_9GAMM|nr:DUF4815 domain-containing protein [Pseudoalteromonas citrea]TMP46330.1 hypothetical protein CWB97_02410 [Pseudoalteromonas citrea]TMP63106.1 hypothetical protein CWB96_00415 [Pseudoalteromonas citrea]
MAVIGVITNDGLSKTISAANKEGWNISPTKFAISATKGELNSSRDTESTNPTWFESTITSRRVISDNSIEFICNIPPNATTEDQNIGEIYLFGEYKAEDTSLSEPGTPFLLAVGQPSQALTYYFDGSISLRLVVTLTNINISELFHFEYTDTVEIDEHNMDAEAHPKLVKAISQWVKGLGNALLRNGQLLSGGSLFVSKPAVDTGVVQLRADAAAIYINGAVLYVPETQNSISASATETFKVGVWVDNSGAENVGGSDLTSPDAAVEWGVDYENDAAKEFYPIYTVSNGALLEAEVLLSDEAQELVAKIVRYDADAHGNYAVHGLNVQLQDYTWDDNKDVTTYNISGGRAHIDGREIDLLHDLRRGFPNAVATYKTTAEPVSYVARDASQIDVNGQLIDIEAGSMRVELDYGPVESVQEVIATVSSTADLERATVGGGALDINETKIGVTSVTRILRVYTSSMELVQGVDWSYKNGGTDENPTSNQDKSTITWLTDKLPTGSSFSVDFHHNVQIENDIVLTSDRKGFEVPGTFIPSESVNGKETSVVPGTELLVDYRWRMPRIDRLFLNSDGMLTLKQGVASPFAPPTAPALPDYALSLAEIYHTWWKDPALNLDGIQAVKMSDMNKMQNNIIDLYDLVALERLKSDTSRRAPSATHGLFVDPMLDDDMRDINLEDMFINDNPEITAKCQINPAREELVLPIDMQPNSLNPGKATKPWTLEYEHSVLIDKGRPVEQIEKTGSMKVNPYAAFKPIPAKMTLIPAVDIWTESKMDLKSGGSINSTVVNHGVFGFRFNGNVSSQKVGSTSRAAEFLRGLDVEFTLEGMYPNEEISSLKFDDVVLPVLQVDNDTPKIADANGVLKGKFTIAPNTYSAGRKLVKIVGSFGTEADASFTGKGTITTEEWQTKFSGGFQRWDPLAQTFTLTEDHYISGVDIKMTHIGTEQIVVQLRTTTVGIPDKTIAEVRVNPADLVLYDTATHRVADARQNDGRPESYSNPGKFGWSRITFDPTFIEAGREYAFVVLTDDPDHEMAIAELGGINEESKVISEQAYQIGVMLSSSNATTWTPHQSSDLTFRLLRAEFINTEREIPLGEHTVENLSDIMVMGGAIRPSTDSDISIAFTDSDGVSFDVNENTPVRLDSPISGKLAVKAKLRGNGNMTPLMWPELLLMAGSQASKAVYCTRSFTAGEEASSLSVTFEALLKGDAAVQVYYADQSSGTRQWIEMHNPKSTQLDADLHEYTYKVTGFQDTTTRILLVLSGSALHRPAVSNMRAMAY